jgi:hypothetical protein
MERVCPNYVGLVADTSADRYVLAIAVGMALNDDTAVAPVIVVISAVMVIPVPIRTDINATRANTEFDGVCRTYSSRRHCDHRGECQEISLHSQPPLRK